MKVTLPLVSGPSGQLPRMGLVVWLADLTYTQQGISAETMPQAVAGIATYAAGRMRFAEPVRIFKYPEALAEALDGHRAPDVIGFSHYIWNANLALEFAQVIKERSPQTVVVLGGPHYPLDADQQARFWHERFDGIVDFYVEGEGEEAFADLLLALQDGEVTPGSIPGVHFMTHDGTLAASPPRPRLPHLSSVPSPYVAGLMDEFFDGRLVPTVQTNRGCPFKCTFCQEGTAYFQKVAQKPHDRIEEELHYIGRRMQPLIEAGTARNELLITDSNFGMFPQDAETCRVLAECRQLYGWPRVINVTTGKNQRDRVLSAVAQVPGAISLSGAVQSLDTDVLAAVERENIDAGKLMAIALAARQSGARTHSEVILALPRDSKERHLNALRELMDGGFDRINMFQLTLLPGSEMSADIYRREHGLITRWRVLPRCYGRYQVAGREIRAAEADEVCVSVLPSMSYVDYKECRLVNLLVATLYNDGLFRLILALLRAHRVSPMRWLETARALPQGPALRTVMRAFADETDTQLWNSRERLLDYARGHIDAYISGELGNNLLYTYRTRLITEALADTTALAAEACRQTLTGPHPTVTENDRLVAELVTEAAEFHRLKLADIFHTDPPARLTQTARFDLDRLLEDARLDTADPDPRTYLLSKPGVRTFTLSSEQCRTLATYTEQFGRTPWGIGRVLTKVGLTDIVRVHTPHVTDPSPSEMELPSP
ncbi:B12-binding domain-containing radical SAM protein [Streptomyces sp. URMC 129]|uniref:B12-binding domain-containing radical SAM protein n=1 Tax=Streptomyces sp. URMC 129 TaxID=3423407 RepID=UPI003F1C8BB3